MPAQGITITPGSGQLTIVVSAPTVPVDWTITRAIAAVIQQQDPHVGTAYQVKSGEDATSPYSIVITGLTASQVYVVGGWFEFEKADGTFAYGQSVQGTGTPT